MSYISLSEHKKSWIFKRSDLPISDGDKAAIKPMTPLRATTLWRELVSKQVDHPDFFKKGDWAFSMQTWQAEGEWESVWESEQDTLPVAILNHLPWQDNTVVYYCNDQQSVIETTWGTFQRCWKNFLFMDDGALLLAKKRNEVVQFISNGHFRLGLKDK
jgi:hypothetical protein